MFEAAENIRYAVIGDPVAHSVSPAMQNAGFKALGMGEIYGRFHVKPDDLAEFVTFARQHLAGFNATVPHKAALIPLLDEIAPAALAAGSVNTVINRNGKLYGDSTDGYGLETALKEAFDFEVKDSVMTMLGAGGAASATAFELVQRRVKKLYIVNRTVSKAEALAEALQNQYSEVIPLGTANESAVRTALKESAVTVQATSSGLRPGDVPPIPLEWLAGAKGIFDMIYHSTPIQRFARSQGIPCVDGRGMLLHQGAKSFTLWTGQTAPVETMRQALDSALGK